MSPIRATIALAAIGQTFVVLAAFGVLKPWAIVVVMTVVVLAILMTRPSSEAEIAPSPPRTVEKVPEGRMRGLLFAHCTNPSSALRAPSPLAEGRRKLMAQAREVLLLSRVAQRRVMLGMTSVAGVLLPLALYPPVAFDETCYHLPFIEAIAKSGALEFRTDFRFPMFPLFHELLCVPAFLIGGAVATHLVALAETALLIALLLTWPKEEKGTRLLAAAIVIGNPILIQLGTVTYVDVALALFIAAGFYCLDDERFLAAGFLLGTAASVKFLGLFFVVAGLFAARRSLARYALGAGIGILPMYGVLFALTGDPLFPYLKSSIWVLPPVPRPASEKLIGAARLLWDITFARARVNWQPPYSPLFAIAILLVVFRWGGVHLRLMTLVYLALFTFLPQDSRYLIPLLPLVSLAAARHWQRWRAPLAVLSIAIAVGYTGFRLARQGMPNDDYARSRIPELRALEQRGDGRIYQCGAEQLKYFGGRDLVGEHAGPWAYSRMEGQDLNALGFRYLLVSKRACPGEWQRKTVSARFERMYEDQAATLWRVK